MPNRVLPRLHLMTIAAYLRHVMPVNDLPTVLQECHRRRLDSWQAVERGFDGGGARGAGHAVY